MADLEITVEPKKCSGEAVCVGLVPTVFRLDERGRAVVVDSEGAERADIMAAAKTCPQLTISVLDVATQKKLAP
jgi:ferredoxin